VLVESKAAPRRNATRQGSDPIDRTFRIRQHVGGLESPRQQHGDHRGSVSLSHLTVTGSVRDLAEFGTVMAGDISSTLSGNGLTNHGNVA